jgi:3-methyladenine DNA glycosylase AlkD
MILDAVEFNDMNIARARGAPALELSVREQLLAAADERYRQFASSLIPNVDTMIGVRLPILRKLAQQIAKGDWQAYLEQADNEYFEEIMLQGMTIGYVKTKDIEEQLQAAARFIPKIDNWSVCDSFCIGLKATRRHQERVWDFIQPYLNSGEAYDIRFGVVMLLNYYVDEAYVDRALQHLASIKHDNYYVKTAVAWAIATFFTGLPEQTMAFLRGSGHKFDDFTYNKALQKITESLRIDKDTKQGIRSMKRK